MHRRNRYFKESKILHIIRDCVEVYFPITTFILMFLVFIAGIFSRYVLKAPIRWSVDMASILFLWTVGLSSCYAYRTNQHVRFTLLYDCLPLKWKAVTAFLGNLLIAVTFIVTIGPTWKYLDFMKTSRASSIGIYFNVIYFPYMIFLGSTLVYTLSEMYLQFMVFSGLGGREAEEQLMRRDASEEEYTKVGEDKQKGEGP